MNKSLSKSTKKSTNQNCPRCAIGRDTQQQVCFVPDIGYFDVGQAEAILKAQHRRPKLMPLRSLRGLLRRPFVSKRHLKHVDMKKPGIIGHTNKFEFIIDGSHRGMNAIAAKTGHLFYHLTEFETGLCCSLTPPTGTTFKQR